MIINTHYEKVSAGPEVFIDEQRRGAGLRRLGDKRAWHPGHRTNGKRGPKLRPVYHRNVI